MDKPSIDELSPSPWNRGLWSGSLVSVDGTPADDFVRADVAEIVSHGATGDEWDGETAGCARLHDGRFIAWEARYGPTGDGFSADAYGGESDIFFGATAEVVIAALSERGREVMR